MSRLLGLEGYGRVTPTSLLEITLGAIAFDISDLNVRNSDLRVQLECSISLIFIQTNKNKGILLQNLNSDCTSSICYF